MADPRGGRDEVLAAVRDALGRGREGGGREGRGAGEIDALRGESALNIDSSTSTTGGKGGSRSLAALFIEELKKCKGLGRIVEDGSNIEPFLSEIVNDNKVESCVVADSEWLRGLNISGILKSLGVKPLSLDVGRDELAGAQMGVTEAALAIAESGTIVAVCDSGEPRSVSLLPPVHLAIVSKDEVVRTLDEAFGRLYKPVSTGGYNSYLKNCITFVTGPSRTADIGLNLTLGVHGPKSLYAWVVMST